MKINKHFQKNWQFYFVGLIALLAAASALLKYTEPKDVWVCEGKQWVKHGHPTSTMPTADCGVSYQNERQPVAAPDSDMVIYEPAPNSIVSSTVHIRGQAKGNWFFEASFPITIVDQSGVMLAQGTAKAQADWMQSGPVPFLADLTLTRSTGTMAFIILKKDNPSGLPANDAEVRLPIRLAEGETTALKIYFVNAIRDPGAKDCSLVFAVDRSVPKTVETAKAAINQLLAGPSPDESAQGYSSQLNLQSKLKSIRIADGTAYADFDSAFNEGMAGSCRVMAARAQIEKTLLQFPSIKRVQISVESDTVNVLQP